MTDISPNERIRELEAERDKLRKALSESCDGQRYEHLQGCDRAEKTEARIRELEAEVQRDRQACEQQETRHLDNVAKWREYIRELEAERDKLHETLAGMKCPRQLNAGTIAECTRRNQCYCPEGSAFVKTGGVQND